MKAHKFWSKLNSQTAIEFNKHFTCALIVIDGPDDPSAKQQYLAYEDDLVYPIYSKAQDSHFEALNLSEMDILEPITKDELKTAFETYTRACVDAIKARAEYLYDHLFQKYPSGSVLKILAPEEFKEFF